MGNGILKASAADKSSGKSVKITKKPSWTSAMRQSAGLMVTKQLKLRNLKKNKRNWNLFAILSPPNCMVANPEKCQMEVLEQHQMVHQPSMDLGPLSKKLINY